MPALSFANTKLLEYYIQDIINSNHSENFLQCCLGWPKMTRSYFSWETILKGGSEKFHFRASKLNRPDMALARKNWLVCEAPGHQTRVN